MNTKAVTTALFFFFFILFLAAMLFNASVGNVTMNSASMTMNSLTIISGACLGLPTLLFGLLMFFSHQYDKG